MPLLDPATSLLVVIDVQERYLPHLFEGQRVVEACRRAIEGAKRVGVPILPTEQYPKGLGPTAAVLRDALPAGVAPIEKSSLSCLGCKAPPTVHLPTLIRILISIRSSKL